MANPLYRNHLISDDGKVTTIVIETDAYSSNARRGGGRARPRARRARGGRGACPRSSPGEENSEIVNALTAVVERHRAPGFEIYVAGMPMMIDHLMYAMVQDMQRFTGLSILVIAVFLFALFRRVAAVVLPLVGRDPIAGRDARADGPRGHPDLASDADPALVPARGRRRRLGTRAHDLLPAFARRRIARGRDRAGRSATRASRSS